MSYQANNKSQSRKELSEKRRNQIFEVLNEAAPDFLSPIIVPFYSTDREEMKRLGGYLREASQMLSKFKKEMLKEHKDECFNRIQEIRKQHDIFWDDFKRETLNRKIESEGFRNTIIRKAKNARPSSLFGLDKPDVQVMKDLSITLREASNLLSEYKEKMYGEHKQECFEVINDVRQANDAWWEEYKKEKKIRHEVYEQKTRLNIEKNKERYRKTSDALQRVREQADDLEEKIRESYSDEWRSKASEWLSEKIDKIKDMEESLERIEEWIQEDEDKLD